MIVTFYNLFNNVMNSENNFLTYIIELLFFLKAKNLKLIIGRLEN